jgi:hypothetical protein
MIYAKKLNRRQRAWLQKYEDLTGFEPMHQEDIDSGEMTFAEVARENCQFYEDHTSDMYLLITHNIPA